MIRCHEPIEPAGDPDEPPPLGELRFMHQGRLITARLTAALIWQADDETVRAMLNEVFVPSFTACDVHVPVRHFLYQVAERLGADVRVTPHA